MSEVRTLAILIPWVMTHGEVDVDTILRRFGIDRAELEHLLARALMVGLGGGGGDYLDADIDEDDIVTVGWFDGLQRPPGLTRDEAQQLFATASAVADLPGFADVEALQRAVARFREQLVAAGIDPDATPADLTLGGSELAAPLREAAARGRRLRIRYRNADGSGSERLIDPYGPFLQDARWYLDAFDHKRGMRMSLRLDRIIDLEETGEWFTPERPRTSFEIAPGCDAERCVITIGPDAAWLEDRVTPDRVEPLGGDRLRLSFRTESLGWLVPYLLACPGGFVIEEPAALRELVGDQVRRALERYADA